MCNRDARPAPACVGCGGHAQLRALTRTNLICESCSEKLGLVPDDQFENEAVWLQRCLDEATETLQVLTSSLALTNRDKALAVKAQRLVTTVASRQRDSLALVMGA